MAAPAEGRHSNKLLDPLTAGLTEIQALLDGGVLRSIDLVDLYVAQIEKFNYYLHAVGTLAPRSQLYERAKARDEERAAGIIRSPLHGLNQLVLQSKVTGVYNGSGYDRHQCCIWNGYNRPFLCFARSSMPSEC